MISLRAVAFVLSSLVASQALAGEPPEELVTQMKSVSRLISSGNAKRALAKVEKSELLGGEHVCGVPGQQLWIRESVPTLNVNRTVAFRYFADLGVVLRRQGKFDEAGFCVRNSSFYATSAREAAGVMYEAAQLVEKVSDDGFELMLTEPPKHDLAPMSALWRASDINSYVCGDAPAATLLGMHTDGRVLRYVANRAGLEVHLAAEQLWKVGPTTTSLRKLARQAMRESFLRSAMSWFPTPAVAKELKALGAPSEEIWSGELFGPPVGGFQRSSVSFGSKQEALTSLRKEAVGRLSTCRSLRKRRDAGEEISNEDCVDYELKVLGSKQTKSGTFELLNSIAWTGMFESCQSDEGVAVVLFTSKDGAAHLTKVGKVHTSTTCGSGGWGDQGSAGVLDVSSATDTFVAGTTGGSLVSKSMCGEELQGNPFLEGGTKLACQWDGKALQCVGWNWSSMTHSVPRTRADWGRYSRARNVHGGSGGVEAVGVQAHRNGCRGSEGRSRGA